MTTIYKILNPLTGVYTSANTKEESEQVIASIAFEFFLNHTHNSPVSIVTVNEDGSETWRNIAGEETPNYEAVRDEMKQLIAEWENSSTGEQ